MGDIGSRVVVGPWRSLPTFLVLWLHSGIILVSARSKSPSLCPAGAVPGSRSGLLAVFCLFSRASDPTSWFPTWDRKNPGQTIQSDDWALPDSSNRSEMWVSFVLADLMDICPAASIQAASALWQVIWLTWQKCSHVPVSDVDHIWYSNRQIWYQLLWSHSLLTGLDLALLFFSISFATLYSLFNCRSEFPFLQPRGHFCALAFAHHLW